MDMQSRTYHGSLTSLDLARALTAEFNHGNLRAQQLGDPKKLWVQIASVEAPMSGGQTAITAQLTDVEDGVMVQLGQQNWLGVAASLGITALMALRRPLSILGRLDDLAEDLESIQLVDRIWQTLDQTASGLGASFEISERLRRVTCQHCLTANEVGAPACIACGAPLGPVQPHACPKCGFVPPASANNCPNCGALLPRLA